MPMICTPGNPKTTSTPSCRRACITASPPVICAMCCSSSAVVTCGDPLPFPKGEGMVSCLSLLAGDCTTPVDNNVQICHPCVSCELIYEAQMEELKTFKVVGE